VRGTESGLLVSRLTRKEVMERINSVESIGTPCEDDSQWSRSVLVDEETLLTIQALGGYNVGSAIVRCGGCEIKVNGKFVEKAVRHAVMWRLILKGNQDGEQT